ncbi:MAG: hydrogenase nickel incorporation protein HypB [Candidatus Thiodiazotropha sp. (ex Monitilora ramsayi)]|nr:hydrogenase nickel incorporation protein HypB [Candidatus Thiodiazotropha sp. (ex Monitilora ramsayi)]
MCDTCGCNVTQGNQHLIREGGKHEHTHDGKVAVEVLQNLLSENDHQAAHNREHLDNHQVLAINLMSSPGSGKTRLLESTIDALKEKYRIGVIEGDLETENDAERIRTKGVSAVQITTGTACHLDAHMIHDALHQMDLNSIDILFIENVGNLVCPASFDLGQHRNVTLLSVTEGDDKPSKYPVIFRAADHVLITKSDLLAVLDDFEPEKAESAVRQLAVEAPVSITSAKSGEGLDLWLSWLEGQIDEQSLRRSEGKTATPKIAPEGQQLHSHG